MPISAASEVADAVHGRGGRSSCRSGTSAEWRTRTSWREPVGPSPTLPDDGTHAVGQETVRDATALDTAGSRTSSESSRAAVCRAVDAGLDGGDPPANGYLLHPVLSESVNARTDRYGDRRRTGPGRRGRRTVATRRRAAGGVRIRRETTPVTPTRSTRCRPMRPAATYQDSGWPTRIVLTDRSGLLERFALWPTPSCSTFDGRWRPVSASWRTRRPGVISGSRGPVVSGQPRPHRPAARRSRA